MEQLQYTILKSIHSYRNPILDKIVISLDLMNTAYFYVLAILLLFIFWNRRRGVHLLLITSATAVLGFILKRALQLPPPDPNIVVIIGTSSGYGFPSLSAQLAMTFWGYLSLNVRKMWLSSIATGIILIVSITKLYLGVHFPLDVVGGLIVGAAVVFLYISIEGKIMKETKRDSSLESITSATQSPNNQGDIDVTPDTGNAEAFLIEWEDEADKKYIWTRSQVEERYPDPVTPLFGDIFFPNVAHAVYDALGEQLNLLKKGYTPKYAIFNGYVYGNFEPRNMFSKLKLIRIFLSLYKQADEVERNFESKMEVPNLKRVAELEDFPFHKASLNELHEHLTRAERAFREWMIAQNITFFFTEGGLRLLQIETKLLFSSDPTLFSKLTLGLENESIKMNRDIARLAELVRNKANLVSIFESHSGKELLSIVETDPRFRTFKEEFNTFMEQHGYRTAHWDFVHPMWWEAPEIPLDLVRDFVIKTVDIDQKLASQSSGRNEAMEKVKLECKSLWRRPFKRYYLKWVDLAQRYTVLKERRPINMYKVWRPLKMSVRELGKRFVEAQILNDFTDIYFLKIQEVAETLATLATSQPSLEWQSDFKKLVAERRRIWKQQFKITPPSIIEWKVRRRKQKRHKEVGMSGVAGSPGKVTAKACLILNIEEFGKIRSGEILVTKYTNPSWTPLFVLASGIVTETGGMLSHASIVAREYGIPAVVSVQNATKFIKDGETITVDGEKGVVVKGSVANQ